MESNVTTKRHFTLRTLLLIVAVCALAVWTYLHMPRRPTRDTLDQLVGMSESEVQGVLGQPDSAGLTANGHLTWGYDDYIVVDFRDGRCVDAYFP